MMRIALLTFAVPWSARPVNGLYNIAQARALCEAGAYTEIFSVAPAIPRVAQVLGGAAQRQIARAHRYEFEGVRVNTVRAPAAFPKSVRDKVATRWPIATSRAFSHLVWRPLSRALRTFGPGTLLVHGMQPWADLAIRYAQKFNVNLVFIEHSHGDVMRVESGCALHKFVRRAGSHAGATLVVNNEMRDRLDSLGVPRAGVIQNGVNTLGRIPSPGKNTRERFRVLCAGAYYDRKGHRELIDGFARARLDDAELVLVGPPPARVVEQIDRLGIAGRVRTLPLLSNDALLREMARADLFALPSWSESFGLVFMEALGAGTPVLMTTDCGAAAHLKQSKHGWIVPPRDAAAVAVALQAAHGLSPERRNAMGAEGRRLVLDQFSWDQNAQFVIDVIKRCAARTRGVYPPARAAACRA